MKRLCSLFLFGITACSAIHLSAEEVDSIKSQSIGFFFEGSALYLKP